MSWQQAAVHRLLSAIGDDGGWGYRGGLVSAAEPTSVCCLVLAAHHNSDEVISRGLRWLASLQRVDGAVPIASGISFPWWPTAHAVLAWQKAALHENAFFSEQTDRAVRWLLRTRGTGFRSNPAIYGHSTKLRAWPWVEGTHSWIEPTAYAMLALRAVGLGSHARMREAVALLFDRAIPSGGWNYGNPRVFQNTLRPFPDTTGMALAALAGESDSKAVRDGIDYLKDELPRTRAPFSLSWGLIGLAAHGVRPDAAGDWLAESSQLLGEAGNETFFDALLLLGDADPCPIVTVTGTAAHV